MFAPPSSCSRRAVVARWAHAGAGTLGFLAPFLAGHARVVSPARSRPGLCLSCVHTLVAVEKRIVPLLKFPITYHSPPQRVPRSSRTPLPALGFLSSHLEQRAPSQALSPAEAFASCFPKKGAVGREFLQALSTGRLRRRPRTPPGSPPPEPSWFSPGTTRALDPGASHGTLGSRPGHSRCQHAHLRPSIPSLTARSWPSTPPAAVGF